MSYKTRPIKLNDLSDSNRRQLARNQASYYAKYGKPAPVRLVQGNAMQMVRRQNAGQVYSKGSEIKGVDGTVDILTSILATTNTNGQIFVANAVQQGAGSWNRVGRKIRLKSLRIKANIKFTNSLLADVLQNNVRMTVVWDKQPSSNALPTFDTIFGGTDQLGAESTTYLSNLRYDNTERFSVLKDEIIESDMEYGAPTAVINYQKEVDCFIKLKGLITVFSGQSNPITIADISSGALYIIFRCQNASVGVTCLVTNSVIRLRYYDN